MQCACSILWPVWLYNIFIPCLITDKIFENNTEYTMCVLFFSTFFEIFRIVRRNERVMIKNLCWSFCKLLVILVRF